MSAPRQIGFPPPLLSDRPLRLPVVWDDALGFALAKPAGLQVLPDNWYPRSPSLVDALNYQAAQGKGELQRLGLSEAGARAIFQTEAELAGLTLFAKDFETGEFWSNAYGSRQFELKVLLLSGRAPRGEETLHCDLPLARHQTRPEMLVSHKSGKKCETHFRRLQDLGRFSLWEATTPYLRMHQIMLHAFEVGLGVVGDRRYAGEGPLYLSQLKRTFMPKGDEEEAPLYPGPAMYLAEMMVPMPEGGPVTIAMDHPKRFNALLRSLLRHGR
ncbi:MAG: hypothetical protein ACLFR7_13210 [Opitutales bacterium]